MKKNEPEYHLDYQIFTSPLGWILIAGGYGGISLLHFCGTSPHSPSACEAFLKQAFPGSKLPARRKSPLLKEAEEAVLTYLNHRRPLASLPVAFGAGTLFQQRVWAGLREIPFGEVRSYGQVAQAIGSPGAARAVGQACGRNPVPLFVPCHRVIASSGKPGGFTGGIHIKKALLEIEGYSGLMERIVEIL